MTSSDNPIANALKIIGFSTYILGFILGLVIARQSVDVGYFSRTVSVFSWPIAFLIWGSALISGTFTLGFAELIRLSQLQADIANATRMAIKNITINQPTSITPTSMGTTNLPLINPSPSQPRKNLSARGEFDLNKWKDNNI